MPSEPISIRSGEGPAPEPGSRRLSQVPRGVIARTDSTRSSMWVSSVAKWPPARVAIQPPRVEYSKDCGKWRRVSPCSRSWSSSPGPVAPAWIRAASELGSTSSTRSSRRRSSETTGRSPSRGSTPPTTLVPAAERDNRRPLGLGPAQHRLDLRLVLREGDQVRRVLELPVEPPHHIPVGLPQRVRDPLVVPIREQVPKRLGSFNRGARSSTSSSGTGFSTSPPNPNRARIPSAASRSCVAVGAWSSYPHPQCLSRRSPSATSSMRLRTARILNAEP